MKIYTSSSLAENMKIIEKNEQNMQERQAQESKDAAAQEKMKLDQMAQLDAAREQLERDKMALQDKMNQRDNDTRLEIAGIKKEEKESSEDKKVDVDKTKIELEREKHQGELSQKSEEHSETIRSNMAKEQIARTKPQKVTA
jgi:hypothetical protein